MSTFTSEFNAFAGIIHLIAKNGHAPIKGQNKYGIVSTNRNAVQKGSLGVRWEGARRNESKILLSDKMGLT